ncbi:MAG: hypothetical protein E7177_06190 [Erysipelotrichaceae bacterium]|nr:hypothetical protein [Erysipelotrichaceae bacterium]
MERGNYFRDFIKTFNLLKIIAMSSASFIIIVLLDTFIFNVEMQIWKKIVLYLISILLIVFCLTNVRKLKLLFAKYVTQLDFILWYLLFFNVYFLLGYFNEQNKVLDIFNVNIWWYLAPFFIIFFSILFRIVFVYCIKINNKKNVYTLYEFLTLNDISKDFTLCDTPTEKDLFGRYSIIDEISYYINDLKIDKPYTLSVTGQWGEGKTTLLKMIKNIVNKNVIWIDEFDPWLYKDEKSMFYGLLSIITKNLNIDSGATITLINKFISNYISDLKYKIPLNMLNFSLSDESVIEIINKKLKNENKKIVLIMDNIDRANDQNIILIYKLISSILKINNIIYVLSYDQNIIDKVLERNHFDKKFLDKIIQKKIDVPKIDAKKLNETFLALLEKTETVLNINLSEFKTNFIASRVHVFGSVRDLVLFTNSILFVLKKDYGINLSDYIFFRLIKHFNPSLFEEILNNPFYFLSCDKEKHDGYLDFYHIGEFERIKEYQRNLFDAAENKKYLKIIRLMFPAVDDIFAGYSSFGNYSKELNNRRSIASGRYFNLYYLANYNENQLFQASKKVEALIDEINKKGNIYENLNSMFDISNVDQVSIYIMFNNYFERINSENVVEICTFLIRNSNYFNKTIFPPSADDYNIYFLAEQIGKMNYIDFCELKPFLNQYNKLNMNKMLIYYLNKNYSDENKVDNKIIDDLEKMQQNLISKIIANNVDIYSENNYARRNIYALDTGDKEKNFLQNILTKENIILFLKDFIGCIKGKNYQYYLRVIDLLNYIDYDNIQSLRNELDEGILEERDKFVLKIFDATDFINLKEDNFNRKDVVPSNDEIEFW